jgi:hypothetical protein
VLGKSIAGSAFRLAGGAARAVGRAGPKTKIGLALGAGAAAPPVADYAENHPGGRAAVGAVAAGAAAAALTRGHAIGAVKRASRALYTTDLKNMVRAHLQTLGGAAPSPHHVAQQHAVLNAINHRAQQQNILHQTMKARLLSQAKARRAAAIAAIKPARKTIAGAAALGAAAGYGGGHGSRWQQLPSPENP